MAVSDAASERRIEFMTLFDTGSPTKVRYTGLCLAKLNAVCKRRKTALETLCHFTLERVR